MRWLAFQYMIKSVLYKLLNCFVQFVRVLFKETLVILSSFIFS